MSEANVVTLLQPGSFGDSLTEVLRNGARTLLAQAVEAEVREFLAKHSDLKTASGLTRMVRHGHLPAREVMTGIGPSAFASLACAIEGLPARMSSASASRQRSCRPMRGARGAWMC